MSRLHSGSGRGYWTERLADFVVWILICVPFPIALCFWLDGRWKTWEDLSNVSRFLR